MDETALIVAVPEAEPLVGPFRARHDTSAAAGVPAHVTLLSPFVAGDALAAADLAALAAICRAAAPFDFVLVRTARFGGRILYLVPEPEAPFLALMRAIWDRWPSCPPYDGAVPREVVRPHLTVADGAEAEEMDRIERALLAGLPIAARASEVGLVERRDGRWTRRASFPLGGRRVTSRSRGDSPRPAGTPRRTSGPAAP